MITGIGNTPQRNQISFRSLHTNGANEKLQTLVNTAVYRNPVLKAQLKALDEFHISVEGNTKKAMVRVFREIIPDSPKGAIERGYAFLNNPPEFPVANVNSVKRAENALGEAVLSCINLYQRTLGAVQHVIQNHTPVS